MSKQIAIITDIHGNSFALRAVLHDIDKQKNIDHIYCLGDLIAIGHETNEVLSQLLARQYISYVQGNHDEAILAIRLGKGARSKGRKKSTMSG